MPITFSAHALDMLAERGIDRTWAERTIAAPDFIEPDPTHADRTRAYRAVPERGGRVLRVVYTRDGDEVRIITLFLDRGRSQRP